MRRVVRPQERRRPRSKPSANRRKTAVACNSRCVTSFSPLAMDLLNRWAPGRVNMPWVTVRWLQPASSWRSPVPSTAWMRGSASLRGDRAALKPPMACPTIDKVDCQPREVAHQLLHAGAVFRLLADGLERTYQVEIGTVVWKLPPCLKRLSHFAIKQGWMQGLGDKGLWVVERVTECRSFHRRWMVTRRHL